MSQSTPSAIVLYHFFYPDDVVSARHFSDFAEELVNRGWKVTALTSNRYCRYPRRKIILDKENWKGVEIIRISRPGWNQANIFLRVLNSLWMMIGWILKLLRMPKTDVVIIGSDPQLSQFIFPMLKLFKKQRFLVYWCYDLYPEAIIANGAKGITKYIAERLTSIIGKFYNSVDIVADLGSCMRKRLDNYNSKALHITLTPWALVEPNNLQKPDPEIRYELFGDAQLALLYSGNMGKAHDFSLFLELARKIYKENPRIIFCFACRGNRYEELRNAVKPDDYNVRFASFADESELEKRLNSADIHLLSLRPEWEGIVVPSKFFGSLAVGKPLIYSGPEESAIAKWIREFNIGLVLTEDTLEKVKKELLEIVNQPQKLYIWRKNTSDAYNLYFSKKVVMNQWDKILRSLIE